jgi:predicted HTH domain antitoxin
MSQIVIDIPEQSLLALNRTPEELSEVLRMAAAVKLYELGQLSSGAAAELAGVPKPVFLWRLADYGVDNFTYDAKSLKRDTRLA